MENLHTLKPYLIEAVYNWCLDNELGVYIEVQDLGNKKLFDISSNYVANLLFAEEGISFITMINKEEKQMFINYNDISKIYSKLGAQGLDFKGMDFPEKKERHLSLIVNNTNVINNNKQ